MLTSRRPRMDALEASLRRDPATFTKVRCIDSTTVLSTPRTLQDPADSASFAVWRSHFPVEAIQVDGCLPCLHRA